MSTSLGTLTVDLIARTGGFEAGMDRAQRVADRRSRQIEREMKQRADAISAAFTKVATGVGAALGAIQFTSMVKGAVDTADALSKLSQRTGVVVEDLSALKYAASLNDATFADLGNALKGLSNRMLAAQAGSGEAAGAFAALGIKVTDASGKLRRADDVMLDIADRFKGMEDGAGKSALAMRLMEEAGIRLIPTLNNGRDGIEAMRTEAESLGAIIGTDFANQSAAFNDNVTRMQTMTDGLAVSIGNALIPKINELTAEFLEANKAVGSIGQTLNAQLNAALGIGEGNTIRERIADVDRMIEQADRWQKILPGGIGGALIGTRGSSLRALREVLRVQERSLAMAGDLADFEDARDRRLKQGTIRTPAPALPKVPTGKTSAPKVGDDLGDWLAPILRDFEQYEVTLTRFRSIQNDAVASTADLTSSQRAFFDLLNGGEWGRYTDAQQDAIRAQFEAADAIERTHREQAKLNDLLSQTPTAVLEQQRATMQFLADAFEQGRISAAQFSEAAAAALGNLPGAVTAIEDKMLDLETVANDAARTMGGAFGDFISGTDRDFGDMVANFLRGVAQMIAQAAALQAIRAAAGAMGYGGAFADGGAFGPSGQITAFARGGVVDRPQMFKFAAGGSFKTGLMGEAGPEAIMPLKRGPDGRLGVSAHGGGGDTNIEINIAPTGNSQTGTGPNQQEAQRLGKQIEGAVMAVLVREQRPGGTLYR